MELVSQNCIPESLCWAPQIQSEHDRRVPPGTGTQAGRQFGVGRKRGLVKMSGVEPGSTEDRGFPGGPSGQASACQRRRPESHGFDPWVGKIPRRRQWQSTPVFLPGKSHGWRSLAGCNPWGHKELDTTEQFSQFSRVGIHISFRKGRIQVKVKSLSHVRLFATPWTVAYQASPSMGFSRQEY